MRKVVDYETNNECDSCGCTISIGEIYWAESDDKELICVKCMDEQIYLSDEIVDEIIREEKEIK